MKQTSFKMGFICCASLRAALLLLLALPGAAHGQDYTCTTSDGGITIARYSGPGGAVTIPDAINGLPVTSIGNSAFAGCSSLTSVTIPGSVADIADHAFYACTSLTDATLGNGVINLRDFAFSECTSLTSVTIPDSVTNIGESAFALCTRLGNVSIGSNVTTLGFAAFHQCWNLPCITIPKSVTSIGDDAFAFCIRLSGAFFQGNAPSLGGLFVFYSANNATVFYEAGTTGWGPIFGGHPTGLW